MFKRVVAIMMLSMLIGVPSVVAQEAEPEPGAGAASQLPEASVLGEGWSQYDVVSPDLLGGYAFEMTPDVFREGAAAVYTGPDGARAIVVNLVVTDSRVAVRASWEDATDLLDRLTQGVDSDYRRAEALETLPPPEPCVEAKRVEGVENAYLTPVGATMCAQDPDNVWIFLVSGTLNGASGVPASDALVATALGGGSGEAVPAATPAVAEPTPAQASGAPPNVILDYGDIPTDGRFLGSAEAPVDFVVYLDFQCPFCKQFDDLVLPRIVETFVVTGDVRVEWRPMPIISDYAGVPLDSPGNESVQAAEAAFCAADQDQSWPYTELLFAAQGAENSGVFNDAMLKRTAADVGLDTDAFDACLDSGKHEADVLAMRQAGLDSGVRGTPTFLINDQLVNYTAQGYDMLESQLNDALAGREIEN